MKGKVMEITITKIWIVLFGVAELWILWKTVKEQEGWFYFAFSSVIACFIGFAVLFFVVILGPGISADNNFVWITEEGAYSEIFSVRTGQESGLDGGFVLGCGSIHGGSESVYIYYVRDEKGGFHRRQWPTDNSVIYYTDEPPKMRFVTHRKVAGKVHKFWGILGKSLCESRKFGEPVRTLELYVPKNTVERVFQFD